MTNNTDVHACGDAATLDLGFVELSWMQMAILGVIQGITELLPISSTAHLRVIPGILGWRDPGSEIRYPLWILYESVYCVQICVLSGRETNS